MQLGPNVSIGAHAVVGAGTRIKDSIILAHSRVLDHSFVLYSIIGEPVVSSNENYFKLLIITLILKVLTVKLDVGRA